MAFSTEFLMNFNDNRFKEKEKNNYFIDMEKIANFSMLITSFFTKG